MTTLFKDFLTCPKDLALMILDDYIHHPIWFTDEEQIILASVLALADD